MIFGSVCSGIEAASVAWEPLGWRACWFAEVDKPASLVLAHRFPDVPNHGDMTLLAAKVLAREIPAPDLLVGGTPCQAFSVAGLRGGLADARGQLTLAFVLLADAIDQVRREDGQEPCIIVWENVPGVLNHRDNPFGCFLAGLAGESDALVPAGKRWTNAGAVLGPERAIAWRTLDAQYVGLAQRRRRVFVVAGARAGFDPAAILLEFDGVRRDSPPRRGTGEDVAGTLDARTQGGGFPGTDGACANHVVPVSADVAERRNSSLRDGDVGLRGSAGLSFAPAVSPTLRAGGNATGGDRPPGTDVDTSDSLLVYCMAHGQGGAEVSVGRCPTLTCNHEAPIASYVVHGTQTPIVANGRAHPLGRNSGQENVVAYAIQERASADLNCGPGGKGFREDDYAYTLEARHHVQSVAYSVALRGRDGGGTAELGDDLAGCLRASGGGGDKAHVLAPVDVLAFDTTQITSPENGSNPQSGGPCHPLAAGAHPPAVCVTGSVTHTLRAEGFDASEDGTGRGQPIVNVQMAVRRLMPVECERLQGFPDNWTLVPNSRGKLAADGPRYKQCGNSMATNVMCWIGGRIARWTAANPLLIGHNGGPAFDPEDILG